MKQAADRLLFYELVVKLHGLIRGQHVCRDVPSFEKRQRLVGNLKALLHSPREHDNRGAVVQEFLHICRLDSRHVLSPRLSPIPFP